MRNVIPLLVLAAAAFVLLVGWDFGFTTRHQPIILLGNYSWDYEGTAVIQLGPGHAYLELPNVEEGETLSLVEVRYIGGPGHLANPVGLGMTPSTLEVYHVDRDGNATKLCWKLDSPHQSPAQYEQPHSVVASGCSHVVAPASGRLVLRWTGEFTDAFFEGGIPDFRPGGRILSIKTVTY